MIGIPSDIRIEPAHILVTINGLRIGGLAAGLVEFQPYFLKGIKALVCLAYTPVPFDFGPNHASLEPVSI